MAKSCSLVPQVRNKNTGELEDSKLFTDISNHAQNRNDTLDMYLTVKNGDFIRDFSSSLILDNLNEPTFESLYKAVDLQEFIPKARELANLNRQIGYYDNTGKTIQHRQAGSRQILINKAREFNSTHPLSDEYRATVISGHDYRDHKDFNAIKVVPRDKLNSLESLNMEYNSTLNEKLRDILSRVGVSVSSLNELEDARGISGVTEFARAEDAAEGIITLIRLAKGEKGERALPEEFAHFVIEGLKDQSLVNRLVSNIEDNGFAREIIGEEYPLYFKEYNGDQHKLAKEAAGKLLSRYMLKEAAIENVPNGNLLSRVIEFIKSFFRSNDYLISDIRMAMRDANKTAHLLTKNILSDENFTERVDIRNIGTTNTFYQLEQTLNRDQELLQKIIDNELKRLAIFERGADPEYIAKQAEQVRKMESYILQHEEIQGISNFISSGISQLKYLSKKLSDVINTNADLPEKFKVLRDIRNYSYSYASLINDIREAMSDDKRFENNRYSDKTKNSLDKFAGLINEINVEYNKVALPIFIEFITPFVGEEALKVPVGKLKGKDYKLADILTYAEQDIGFLDRWLNSMANASNYTLRLFDSASKVQHNKARLKTVNDQREIVHIAQVLEEKGIKDAKWMFEKDSKGNLTGNYIDRLNWGQFNINRKEFEEQLNKDYPDPNIGDNARTIREKREAWVADNTEVIDGLKIPKMIRYKNDAYSRLSAPQREYYDAFMRMKKGYDDMIPPGYTSGTNAIQIRKDLVERIKSSDKLSKTLAESIKSAFLVREDDVDFGTRPNVQDFEGREVQRLPIYYTSRLKDPNELSIDTTSTLIAYADMANTFDAMNEVIDALEVGRDLVRDMKVQQTSGGKPIVETFKSFGRDIENKLVKRGAETRMVQRLDDFFEMQIYGKYIADEGTLWGTKISKAKMADNINQITALNTMALNSILSISNVETARAMFRIEAAAGEFFNFRDLVVADKTYTSALPSFLGQMGSRVKTNKLYLWNELFDVLQEFDKDVRDYQYDRKTWFSRMFSTNSLFFGTNAGEHWIQTRTSLAISNREKMKSPTGKLVTLYDAMEVVYINPSRPSQGAKLQVKKGYTKQDGSQFTNEDTIRLTRRIAGLNQRMNGVYNKQDRNALQKLALGRMAMMFRKWMPVSVVRRFQKAEYNNDLDSWAEGYYNTMWRFVKTITKDLKSAQLSIGAHWNELTELEKGNMRRGITELAQVLVISILMTALDHLGDKDRPWAQKMAALQLRRLRTETGVLTPTPWMFQEGLKIIQSPAAGVNTIQGLLNLADLFQPWNWDEIMQSGRYKGQPRIIKTIMDSPLVPMNRTVYRGLNPETVLPFYKQ